MKSTNIIFYAIAFVFPLIFFLVVGDNLNERQPILCWIMCPVLMAGAGLFTSKGFPWTGRLKWIALSVIVGLVEAALLVWAV